MRVLNYNNTIITCEYEPQIQELLAEGAEEIDISIFGDYANEANNENTTKVNGVWTFDEASVLAKIEARENTPMVLKLKGIEFEGVMCSATAQDMWGLSSVEPWVRAGNNVNFKFDNGSVLALTNANIDSFQSIWIPFRSSFFLE